MFSVPPYWILEPAREQNVILGSAISLHCQADGFPKPVVTWKQALGNYSFCNRYDQEGNFEVDCGRSPTGAWQSENQPKHTTHWHYSFVCGKYILHSAVLQFDSNCMMDNGRIASYHFSYKSISIQLIGSLS